MNRTADPGSDCSPSCGSADASGLSRRLSCRWAAPFYPGGLWPETSTRNMGCAESDTQERLADCGRLRAMDLNWTLPYSTSKTGQPDDGLRWHPLGLSWPKVGCRGWCQRQLERPCSTRFVVAMQRRERAGHLPCSLVRTAVSAATATSGTSLQCLDHDLPYPGYPDRFVHESSHPERTCLGLGSWFGISRDPDHRDVPNEATYRHCEIAAIHTLHL